MGEMGKHKIGSTKFKFAMLSICKAETTHTGETSS